MLRKLVTAGLLAAAALGPGAVAAQEQDYPQHFRVYTGRGAPASLDDIVKAMAGVDVVLVGETHTDPIGHYVETELFRGALTFAHPPAGGESARPVALSLEMFERDVQDIVDEYLQGLITEEQFVASARPWDYYETDYRPMVELAKAAGVPVIAANAPRRYVNRVSRLGRDAVNQLPARAKAYLPPLPWPQPSEAYRKEWTDLMATMPMTPQCNPPGAKAPAPGHAAPDSQAAPPHQAPPAAARPSHMASFMENGLQAQSLWDASMANAITTFLTGHPNALVLHAVGGFHVAHFHGIPEQIRNYRPNTRMLVVSMETADDFRTFDQKLAGEADFVVLTDSSLDLDYQRNCMPRTGK